MRPRFHRHVWNETVELPANFGGKLAPEVAEAFATLPPDQQQALIGVLTAHVVDGWAKQWGALPLDEPAPETAA